MTTLSRRSDQCQRFWNNPRTNGSGPDVLPIGVNGHGLRRVDRNRARLRITHDIKRAVISRINRMELAQDGELRDGVDEADVEQAVVEFGGGQHAETSAVRRRITECAEQRLSGELRSVVERCGNGLRAMSKESAQCGQGVTSVAAREARHAIANRIGFCIETRTGDTAEVRFAFSIFFRDVTHLRLHDGGIQAMRWTWEAAFFVGEGPRFRGIGHAVGILAFRCFWCRRIFEKSEIDLPGRTKRVADKAIPGGERVGLRVNADGVREVISAACGNDEQRARGLSQRTQNAVNAAIASDNDDCIRQIAALDFVSTKDVHASALKRCEDGVGFVRVKDRSDAQIISD